MAGGTPVFLDCPESQGFLPSMDDFAALISPRTKAFILNTPSNPNGCVWSRRQLEELGELAVRHDFYIVADEIYEKLVYSGAEHISVATLSDEIKKRTILINGVSKAYAMTGFRIGYAAGPRDVIEAMSNYQSQAASAPNSAAQHAAAIALSMPQGCVEDMRRAFEERRDELVRLINGIPSLSCRTPDGAFYAKLSNATDQERTAVAVVGVWAGEKLMRSTAKTVTVPAGGMAVVQTKALEIGPGEHAEAYLWDGLNSQNPISANRYIK